MIENIEKISDALHLLHHDDSAESAWQHAA